MSDFLLDFRPRAQRQITDAVSRLKFTAATRLAVFDEPAFQLILAQTGEPGLWAPYRAPDGTLIALAGRVVFEETEWQTAGAVPGVGGLAAKAIYQRYQQAGPAGLESISGNAVVLLVESSGRTLHLVTDCSGVFPAYGCATEQGPVFGSHPDVLATVTGESGRLDEVSLAEFVVASTVTPPFTFYQRLRFLDQATRYTFDLAPGRPASPAKHPYFAFVYRGDDQTPESDLAEELAATLRRAVRRRTQPRFGTTAVALSGGLDSRALLACTDDRERLFAFCCYDEPTREFRTAEAIARALDVRFLPLPRPFEYYGDHAAAGVRLAAGMGTFANNHFLGMLPRLQAEGMQNLLTGCYCDYLFKGLPLNRRRHRITGRETLAPFRHEFYFSHHLPGIACPPGVRERWESRVPAEYQAQDSPAAVFQVEARRTFPLCYEGDNQQRVVPQRVTGWPLVLADREILELYRRIPYRYKLNQSLFRRAVRLLCAGLLASIPDANTGARVDATPFEQWTVSRWQGVRRKLRRPRQSLATEESWPNWSYYLDHSRKLAELWQRPQPEAFDFFRRLLGPENVVADIRAYQGDRLFLFVSLLTLKLWFEQRGR